MDEAPALITLSSNLPVATSGDPTDPVIIFSLPAVRGLLHDPDRVALTWPAFAALRAAARATKKSRLRLALSALVSEARLVFGACCLKARESPPPALHDITRPGAELHSWIRALLEHGTFILPEAWHGGSEDCHLLYAHMTCLVAATPCCPPRPACM